LERLLADCLLADRLLAADRLPLDDRLGDADERARGDERFAADDLLELVAARDRLELVLRAGVDFALGILPSFSVSSRNPHYPAMAHRNRFGLGSNCKRVRSGRARVLGAGFRAKTGPGKENHMARAYRDFAVRWRAAARLKDPRR
jgi:hypothetical protein